MSAVTCRQRRSSLCFHVVGGSYQAEKHVGVADQFLRGNLVRSEEPHCLPLAQDDVFLTGVGTAREHMEADPGSVGVELFHHPVQLKDSGQPGLLEQLTVGGCRRVLPGFQPSARRRPPARFGVRIATAVLHQHPPGAVGENNNRDLFDDLHASDARGTLRHRRLDEASWARRVPWPRSSWVMAVRAIARPAWTAGLASYRVHGRGLLVAARVGLLDRRPDQEVEVLLG
jgi:hypothetical protein